MVHSVQLSIFNDYLMSLRCRNLHITASLTNFCSVSIIQLNSGETGNDIHELTYYNQLHLFHKFTLAFVGLCRTVSTMVGMLPNRMLH